MVIFNSKRIKELHAENEELKSFIKNLTEKETYLKQFDELLKKARIEFANITLKKDQVALTLERLEKEKEKLIPQIQKLRTEIEHLREIKLDEQSQIVLLNDKSVTIQNGFNQIDSAKKLEIQREIELTGKRKLQLEKEIAEKEKRFREVYQRVLDVSEMEQNLDSEIKRKKEEIKLLGEKKNSLLQEQLKDNNGRTLTLNSDENKKLIEAQQRIKQLTAREAELQKKLEFQNNQLQTIDEKIKEKISVSEKDYREKLFALKREEQKLIESINEKKQSLSELQQSITGLNELINKSKTEKIFTDETGLNEEAESISNVIKSLKREEATIRESIEQLIQTESLKRELISNLNDELSVKEIQFASVEKDYETKSNRLKEISLKNKILLEELAAKTNELSVVEKELKSKAARVNEINAELTDSENKLFSLQNEIADTDRRKSELEEKMKNARESWEKMDGYYKKLKDVVPLLEKRKEELEKSNSAFEKRFADMFRHYSTQMGEMYKKKNLLEQMLIKKEKDVNEKDQTLMDTLSALEEVEKVFSIRKTETEVIEDLLKTINEQRELLNQEITMLENNGIEKRLLVKELNIESELFQKKLAEFENALRELFQKSEARFNKNTERKNFLDGEIKEYENRLNELNIAIKDSMNELVNLKATIGRIKVEHEEHRIDINKLAAVKKKLEEEINKHKIEIDKYMKIKEKIRQEQNLIKMKKEILASKKISDSDDEITNSFEPTHLNWFKI